MTDASAIVREALRYYSDEETLGDGMDIAADLGLDSLERWGALGAVERRLDIEISDIEWSAAETVGDAIRLVETKLAARAA